VGAIADGFNVATAAPTPQGGTIADGVYDLTRVEIYTGAGGASGSTGSTGVALRMQFAGTTAQSAILFGSSVYRSTETLSFPGGTGFVQTQTCGALSPQSGLSYTATATTVTLYDHFAGNDRGMVLTKQ
jgi:hypothetical protein